MDLLAHATSSSSAQTQTSDHAFDVDCSEQLTSEQSGPWNPGGHAHEPLDGIGVPPLLQTGEVEVPNGKNLVYSVPVDP